MTAQQEALAQLIQRAREENAILARNGAEQIARGREQLLGEIEETLGAADEVTVTAEVAAERSGAALETVRRAVRNGEIPDLRERSRGRIRIRVADIPYLAGKARPASTPPTEESGASGDTGLAAVAWLAGVR